MFNNSFALNIARSGIFLSFKKGHRKGIVNKLSKHPIARKLANHQRIKIEKEIKLLLELNILSINNSDKIYPNQVFMLSSDHRSTKDRLIFDMSCLNKSIHNKKFTLTKMSEIIPHIFENQYACTFDIKKAYYHVPINPKYKKFFSFPFNHQNYSYNAMPFGLCTAPYLFTKFISPILEYLRVNHNITIFSYLDDFLILEKTKAKLQQAISTSIKLFEDLGFLINKEKSLLEPTSKILFLGIQFDLEHNTMKNSQRLINKMIDQSKLLIKKKKLSRIQLEKFIGLGNFMSYYMKNGRHYLHPIIKITNNYFPYHSRHVSFLNRSDLKEHLLHWTKETTYQEIPIPNILPQATLEVDSSNQGWGATLIHNQYTSNSQGKWSESEKGQHINTKELLGVLRSLENLPEEIKNMHLAIHNDNKTTTATLAKLGSNRSAIRQEITTKILQELTKKNCTFEIHHIPGKQMVLADFLSRHNHLMPTEIQLSVQAYQNLTSLLGIYPEVDLFATKFNKKNKRYHSSIQDHQAETVNTFTTNWSKYQQLYAFPPPNQIHKILYKWQKEKQGTLLLIAPNWPTKSWYSPLQKMSLKKVKIPLQDQDLFIITKKGKQFFPADKFHLTAHQL